MNSELANNVLNYQLINYLIIIFMGTCSSLFYSFVSKTTDIQMKQSVYYFSIFFLTSSMAVMSGVLVSYNEVIGIAVCNSLYLLSAFSFRQGIILRTNKDVRQLRNNAWLYLTIFMVAIVLNVVSFIVLQDSFSLRIVIVVIAIQLVIYSTNLARPIKEFPLFSKQDKTLYIIITILPVLTIGTMLYFGYMGASDLYFELLMIIQVGQVFIWSILLLVVMLMDSMDVYYKQSIKDGLTNVYNRMYLKNSLNTLYHSSEHIFKTLLYIDIDHFKKVNDNYGHVAGDQVIIAVAQTIQASVKKTDTVARMGGEEFAVICDTQDEKHMLDIAERIRSTIESLSIVFEGNEIPVSVSIGATILQNTHETGIKQSIQRADDALYKAKQSGRNQVSVF